MTISIDVSIASLKAKNQIDYKIDFDFTHLEDIKDTFYEQGSFDYEIEVKAAFVYLQNGMRECKGEKILKLLTDDLNSAPDLIDEIAIKEAQKKYDKNLFN